MIRADASLCSDLRIDLGQFSLTRRIDGLKTPTIQNWKPYQLAPAIGCWMRGRISHHQAVSDDLGVRLSDPALHPFNQQFGRSITNRLDRMVDRRQGGPNDL